MSDILLLSWFAGVGMALVSGPLGCFVVWRRMAYFGDTMAHGALLGVAMGMMFHINLTLGVVLVSSLIALILLLLRRQHALGSDTLLGILSHSALSLGLVVLGFMSQIRIDLLGYLFGDILAVSPIDILGIYLGDALVLTILAKLWHPLLLMTVHEDIARAEGVAVDRIQLIFMLLIALVIAMTMKVVGVLLVTSMLIIPAATARNLAHSPEAMALLGSVNGMLAVSLGLAASYHWDTPAGPAIVVAAMTLFIISLPASQWTRWKQAPRSPKS
ncbi:MAG: zinc ABC transporter permease subunit ZnuB [Magnetococcales bacterium]|nr:zinc ABC transporter permease subunit ZnuB [Magnetococcales bacterium]